MLKIVNVPFVLPVPSVKMYSHYHVILRLNCGSITASSAIGIPKKSIWKKNVQKYYKIISSNWPISEMVKIESITLPSPFSKRPISPSKWRINPSNTLIPNDLPSDPPWNNLIKEISNSWKRSMTVFKAWFGMLHLMMSLRNTWASRISTHKHCLCSLKRQGGALSALNLSPTSIGPLFPTNPTSNSCTKTSRSSKLRD